MIFRKEETSTSDFYSHVRLHTLNRDGKRHGRYVSYFIDRNGNKALNEYKIYNNGEIVEYYNISKTDTGKHMRTGVRTIGAFFVGANLFNSHGFLYGDANGVYYISKDDDHLIVQTVIMKNTFKIVDSGVEFNHNNEPHEFNINTIDDTNRLRASQVALFGERFTYNISGKINIFSALSGNTIYKKSMNFETKALRKAVEKTIGSATFTDNDNIAFFLKTGHCITLPPNVSNTICNFLKKHCLTGVTLC